MRNFSQWIRLIHKLRKLIRSEERIDDRRQCTCIDQIGRCEHLVVTDVHTLTDRTRHTGKTYTKLSVKLLSYGTYTTVGQVVDIIHFGFGIDQVDQILHDSNDILTSQNFGLGIGIQLQFAIDAVTSYITQIITFVREEQTVDNTTRSLFIWWFGVTQLTIDMFYRFFFRV